LCGAGKLQANTHSDAVDESVVHLSNYFLERLRDDGEFILYRAHAKQMESPSVLLLAPASTRHGPWQFQSKTGRWHSYSKILAEKLSMDSFRARWN